MIHVRISDGLGNQIFQYAFAKTIQLKFKTEVSLEHVSHYRDIYSLKILFFGKPENLPSIDKFGQEYLLDKFNITLPSSNIRASYRLSIHKGSVKNELKKLIFVNKILTMNEIFNRLIFKRKYLSYENYLLLNSKQIGYNSASPLSMLSLCERKIEQIDLRKDTYIRGWWQVPDFAEAASSSLKKELTLKESNKSSEFHQIQTLIQETESVSIHIRQKLTLEASRLEVPRNRWRSTLDYSYYLDSIEFILEQINRPIKFFIFCDDIGGDYVKRIKEYLSSKKVDYFLVSERKGLKEYEEFILMSLCKHSIIANSSFSWWSAWLNSHPNKISIGPSEDRCPLFRELYKNFIQL